jgi:hypothetical protein
MSPRLQRLAMDWKTYAGLIAGAVAGLWLATELLDKLAKAVAGVANLPPEAKWRVAGLLPARSWESGVMFGQLFESELGEQAPHRGGVHGGAPDAISEVT